MKDKIIEILQKVDKYNYCLDSELEAFADELSSLQGEQKKEKKIFNAKEFVESCNDLTTYISGKKVDYRFKGFTIPVVEFNELRERAKEYDTTQPQEQEDGMKDAKEETGII